MALAAQGDVVARAGRVGPPAVGEGEGGVATRAACVDSVVVPQWAHGLPRMDERARTWAGS